MSNNSVTEQDVQKVSIQNIVRHKDIKLGFVHVVNAVRPKHSYFKKEDIFPIDKDDIKYSYKQYNSSYYASCGPRNNIEKPVFFAADKESLRRKTPERNLSIYVHELTHLSVGSHSDNQNGSHPPLFWREYAFNAHKALDNWERLEEMLGASISKKAFIGNIVDKEINRYNIDRRYTDVSSLQHQMARWFETTLKK